MPVVVPLRASKPATRRQLTREVATLAPAVEGQSQFLQDLAKKLTKAIPYDPVHNRYSCEGCVALSRSFTARLRWFVLGR